ncbi:hypothetical protein C0992_005673 [Termitomyces sp. T32_za158]|nr:hypothetical protein C0992_005673 [Termitomyces sp. T32_za158]
MSSADYELLESGVKPSPSPIRRRFTWKRLVVAAVVVLTTVWLFAPRLPASRLSSSSPPSSSTSSSSSPPSSPAPPAVELTFETDLDRTSTASCTQPHTASTPLIHYTLLLDAGSTGSRIHIYKFHNCHASPTLEYEVFSQTQPGLSAFAADPARGAQSLDVLMDEATRVVPPALRPCTPVIVRATAGLRLLHGTRAEELLRAVEERLRRWEFAVLHGAVSVLDGRDEGVYAWVTANYLFGALERAQAQERRETYAVLDLGGASTQIAFEPWTPAAAAAMPAGEHRYEFAMAGRTHVLYQHSYLGYGLMRAREDVHRLVDFTARLRAGNDSESAVLTRVGNPCVIKHTERVVPLDGRNVTMAGEDIASFDACLRVVDLIIAKDTTCKAPPCSFNGVYQPPLTDTFPTGPILLLSYFYDRLAPLLPTHTAHLTVHTISALARRICAGDVDADVDAREVQGRPEYCLDLTYMYALLRRGYDFPDAREVRIAKRVRGTELGWALGAALAQPSQANSGAQCVAPA